MGKRPCGGAHIENYGGRIPLIEQWPNQKIFVAVGFHKNWVSRSMGSSWFKLSVRGTWESQVSIYINDQYETSVQLPHHGPLQYNDVHVYAPAGKDCYYRSANAFMKNL